MSPSELQASPEKYIEVDKVVAEKNPGLAKWLPGFVMRYIKRIIHQEEINEVMRQHGDKLGLPFVRSGLDYLDTTVKTVFSAKCQRKRRRRTANTGQTAAEQTQGRRHLDAA